MVSIGDRFEGSKGFCSRIWVSSALVGVLKVPAEGFKSLEVGGEPRVTGM